jgi:hypothetical protein
MAEVLPEMRDSQQAGYEIAVKAARLLLGCCKRSTLECVAVPDVR